MANKKKNKLTNELRSLQLQRKRALSICLIGVAGIVLTLVVRRALVLTGALSAGEPISDIIVFVLCLTCCFIIGRQISLCLSVRRRIKEIKGTLAN